VTTLAQEPTATAIKTALAAAVADITVTVNGVDVPCPVWDYDEIPGDAEGTTPGALPKIYVVVDLSRRLNSTTRFSGAVMVPLHRLGTRYCADTVSNVRELRRRITAVLESQIIADTTPTGIGPFAFEAESEAIHRDTLGFTGVDDWTF